MPEARHHRAQPGPAPTVVLVPVPVAASQDWGKQQKPKPYKREAWTKPPPNQPVQPIPVSWTRQRENLLGQARRLAKRARELADQQAKISAASAVSGGRIVPRFCLCDKTSAGDVRRAP